MSVDWQEIVESMNTAVIVACSNGNITSMNTAFEDLFMASRRVIGTKNLKDIFFGQTKIFNVIERAKKYNSQYTLREVKFTVPVDLEADITVTCLQENGKCTRLMLEIIRIDRINRLAREAHNIEQQETNRLMMRSMSHEIKNPLSGIRGAAQLLSYELKDDEQKEFTDVIIRESDRLTNLVSRVMGSHKQYASEPVNIHYVIEHVAKLFSASEAGKLNIAKDYDPSLPELQGDDEQLIQAVVNIVKNGIEAQANSDEISIGFRTRLERNFTIANIMHRHLIKLQIWDKGPGVPENIRTQLFNPMITGRAEGTGLGLAITQEIIQRHNGLVVLEEFNEHTCFSIYIPFSTHKNQKGGT